MGSVITRLACGHITNPSSRQPCYPPSSKKASLHLCLFIHEVPGPMPGNSSYKTSESFLVAGFIKGKTTILWNHLNPHYQVSIVITLMQSIYKSMYHYRHNSVRNYDFILCARLFKYSVHSVGSQSSESEAEFYVLLQVCGSSGRLLGRVLKNVCLSMCGGGGR